MAAKTETTVVKTDVEVTKETPAAKPRGDRRSTGSGELPEHSEDVALGRLRPVRVHGARLRAESHLTTPLRSSNANK